MFSGFLGKILITGISQKSLVGDKRQRTDVNIGLEMKFWRRAPKKQTDRQLSKFTSQTFGLFKQ